MEQLSTETVVQTPTATLIPTGRLVSLDAFRGATMALMVLVNTPGDGHHVYGPLQHAAWNGWTPTDVVFPSFMWIVGVAMHGFVCHFDLRLSFIESWSRWKRP